MLGNYLTTALRLLWRERGYAAINVFGLAVGFALCLLIIQLADYQLSVGDFHEKKDRVYRVLGPKFLQASGYSGALPIELGPTLKEQLARSRGGSPLHIELSASASGRGQGCDL